MKVKRIGSQHQAGSDSLLTGQVFFKIYDKYFSEGLDDVKYSGNVIITNKSFDIQVSKQYVYCKLKVERELFGSDRSSCSHNLRLSKVCLELSIFIFLVVSGLS